MIKLMILDLKDPVLEKPVSQLQGPERETKEPARGDESKTEGSSQTLTRTSITRGLIKM